MIGRHGRYDVVVVGGGHNGLVAAAYLARAGRSVLVLERQDTLGGLAVSARPFLGVDARLSRYAYLVSLLPRALAADLGLRVELRPRRISSYTPVGSAGLLVDSGDPSRTAASFSALTGGPGEMAAWHRFHASTRRLAERVFPTMTQPLPTAAQVRALVDDDATWRTLVERPLGEVVEATFADDTVRGVVLTDGLIGTFAGAHDPGLAQNRCFLYHVVGNGTGAWDVPVGGMGALTRAMADAAGAAGATLRTGTEVVAVDPAGAVTFRDEDGEHEVGAGHVLANVAPASLAGLVGEFPSELPEGAQLKVNMVLSRLPRLRDASVDRRDAFAGTFHVHEGYAELAAAHGQASAGRMPALPPCEVYCHSLTDPSILGADLRAAGAHTLTLFGLHLPARLFRADPQGAREAALRATMASIDSVLAEPLADCLLRTPDGEPCLEVTTPVDLEAVTGLPGGHIFHGDLSWPWAEGDGEAGPWGTGRWGVGTAHPRLLLCGAGARRGGGVSGIGGHNAAMAILQG